MSSDRKPLSGDEKGEQCSPYAGYWVACVRGKIIAHGGTPEQARRAALGSRHKETPDIIFMPPVEPLAFSPLLQAVREVLPSRQVIYLVGGAVRDAMLGRTTHDLDFVVPDSGIQLGRRIANKLGAEFFPLDNERDTGRVILIQDDGRRDVLDFASYRGEDLEVDLLGRDFTINAMAVDLHTLSIFDPLGGAVDLREKRLRACTPTSFTDDPVRILRGVRLAAAYGFNILTETRQSMRQAVNLLSNVSSERVRDELFRILEGPQPAASLRALEMLDVLRMILPELPPLVGVDQPYPHVSDIWTHTLSVIQHLDSVLAALAPEYNPETASDLMTGLLVMYLGRYRQQIAEHFAASLNIDRSIRSLLFFAALYHDVAKPLTWLADENGRLRFWDHDLEGSEMVAERGGALHLSIDEIDRLRVVVRHRMRVHFHTNRLVKDKKTLSRRAIYRFFRDTGQAGVDVILLSLADIRATYEHTLPQDTWVACLEVCRILLENLWEKPAETVSPLLLVNGNDLMSELRLPPGPIIGQLLKEIREAQATGKINTRQEALVFGRDWMTEKNSEA